MPSNQLLASKITFNETRPTGRAAPSFNTAVMAFEGLAQKGPIGTPVLCLGFADFVATFGSYISAGYLASCVEGFFATGGAVCYVTRTVHYTDITNATSKTSAAATGTLNTAAIASTAAANTSGNAGPYALATGQTLVTVIDSYGAATATVTAAAASLTASNAGPFAMSDGQTILVTVAGSGSAQTVTFHTSNFVSIGAATSTEVAAVMAASLLGVNVDLNGGKVRLTSSIKGTSAGITVTAGAVTTLLGLATTLTSGSGNVATVAAVTATELSGLVGTAVTGHAVVSVVGGKIQIVSNTSGTGSHVQVTNASTATAVGFDNAVHSGITGGTLATLIVSGKYDGTYANGPNMTVQNALATSGNAAQFNLYVLDSTGKRLESWVNLSSISTNSNFVNTIINDVNKGSNYISVADQGVGFVPGLALNVGTGQYTNPVTTSLTGGNDGLVGLTDVDWVGNQAGYTGLYAFDQISSITVLAVPGIATPAVHIGMISYCETHCLGRIMAILDPPSGNLAADIITYVSSTAALEGLSEYGAIYWPQIQVANPSASVYGSGANITIPPSGDVCGVIARTDNSQAGGVWVQPAGTETGKFSRVLGFETNTVLIEDVRDLVFPHRINPLTTMDGFPRFIDGARVLNGSGNFPSIGQRRGVSYSERSIKAALEPIRHRNNNVGTRSECQRTVWGFLKTQCDLGAFESTIPDQAFYVDFGDALQVQPNVIDGAWGVATTQPAEFIRMNVSQDTRAADAAANG